MFPPMVDVVFALALAVAPGDAREIQVSAPHFSAHWHMTAQGWYGGERDEKEIWTLKDKTSVVIEGGRDAGTRSVAGIVAPALNRDWTRTSRVELGAGFLEKQGGGFIYSWVGAPKEGEYHISYNNDGSPATDIELYFYGGHRGSLQSLRVKAPQADSLPKWAPEDGTPVPLPVGQALLLVQQALKQTQDAMKITNVSLSRWPSDESAKIWYYAFSLETRRFNPEHVIAGETVAVLLDGTVILPQPRPDWP